MNRKILFTSVAAALFASSAFAQTSSPSSATPTARPSFKQLDVDGDGKLSRAETANDSRLSQSFETLDTNKDGFLSSDELRAGHSKIAHAKIDTNGDGSISRDEAKAAPRLSQNFDAIDANRDGNLSRDEMSAWHKTQRAAQAPTPAAKP